MAREELIRSIKRQVSEKRESSHKMKSEMSNREKDGHVKTDDEVQPMEELKLDLQADGNQE